MESWPIVIVGGGPVGLSASILLSLRGIRHVVLERHAGTSIHPKACGVNQRTTEIFRVMGIEEAVRAVAAPDDIKGRTAWYTSLGKGKDQEGADGVDGREIWSRDAWGGGGDEAAYATHSPTRYEIVPQIRLEPILVQRARELSPEALRYEKEVTEVVEAEGEDEDGVRVRVTDRRTGETGELRARFVIAADGGRSLTEQLGVAWEGERDIMDMVSVHLRAPIRAQHPDARNFITWFTHPERGGSVRTGYLYQIGPWPLDGAEARQRGEEWVFACARIASDPSQFDEAAMVARLRDTLKLPALPVELISLSHWHVHCLAAARYRAGRTRRVFLVGDAAHRIPPWGALGMNSGIQDVQNLVWKLALALGDEAPRYDRLLDSYDAERRPIGQRVGRSSLHNLRSHAFVMDAALGLGADQTAEANATALAPFFDPAHPDHAAKLAAVQRAQAVLDLEFRAPGAEVGWFYPSADVDGEGAATRHDGQLQADGQLDMTTYHPSTLPGHNLPHVWLSRPDRTAAAPVALRDLLPLDRLLLIADDAAPWTALESPRVHVDVVGGPDGWQEPTGRWKALTGAKPAVLVRPDGIVAWRGAWEADLAQRWPSIVDRVLQVD